MNSILIVLPNKLGDMVLCFPFIRALKKEYPKSKVGVIVPVHFGELMEQIPEISFIHPFNKKRDGGFFGKIRFGRSISKERKYDLCACLPHSFSSAMIAFFTSSRKRIGFRHQNRSFFFTHTYTYKKQIVHSSEDSLHLLERLTNKNQPLIPYKFTLGEEFISKPLPQGNFVVFNGHSAKQSTRVPTKKSAEIIHSILDQFICKIILIGSPSETTEVQSIIRMLDRPDDILDYAGLSVLETAAIIRSAGILISTDTGIAHLGNTVGAKTIVFFGPIDEKIARPINKDKLRVIKNMDLDCLPCSKGNCMFGDPKCLTELDNNVVLYTLEQWASLPRKIGNEP